MPNKKKLTKERIKPNDFDVKDHLGGSKFSNYEKEMVARNIIIISQWNNNEWLDFSWEKYKNTCKHPVTIIEKEVLNNFVANKFLTCFDGIYSVQDLFIQYLAKFIKQGLT